MLAYGVTVGLLYEYFRMEESTTIKSLKRLLKQRFQYFFKEYLRSPNVNDITRLLVFGQNCGYSGILIGEHQFYFILFFKETSQQIY